MTKMIKVLILVAMITVMLSMGTAQACACGEVWSEMSDEEIVSNINGAEDERKRKGSADSSCATGPDTLEYRSDRVGIDYAPPTKSPARLFSS